MRRITDEQATAVLTGQTSSGTTEDADLARLVADLRLSYRVDSPPPPSPELSAYLDPAYLSQASDRTTSWALQGSGATKPVPNHVTPVRRLAGWLAGLGLVWQVSLGATVACAAVAGAGAVGALPQPAQHVFDKFVTMVPFDRPSDTPDGEAPAEESTFHPNQTRTPPGPNDESAARPAEKRKVIINKSRKQGLPAATTDDGEPSLGDDEQVPTLGTTSNQPKSNDHLDSPDEDDSDDRSEDSASDSADASDEAADSVAEALDNAVDDAAQTSDGAAEYPAETSDEAVDDPEMLEEG